MDAQALQSSLAALVADGPGRISVAVHADSGERVELQAQRVTPAASTIKVPVLVAALRAGMPLTTPISLPAERVGGGGPLAMLASVRTLPLSEVLRVMIALSDNDATNVLIDLVGMPAVGEVLAAAGTRHTVLARRMMDFEAAAQGRQNLTSAADLATVMVALRQGRLLDATATAQALEFLREQQQLDGLPAYLLDRVSVADKPGALAGVRTECALLEHDRRWIAVGVTATHLDQDGVDRGTEVLPVLARIGEAVLHAW